MFSPVTVRQGHLNAGVLFLCDHASPALPPEYGRLGLAETAFERHVAFDIGAAEVAHALKEAFAAPAIMTNYSRLLIDPNRGADDPTLVMRLSDGDIIPGNAGVTAAEIARRKMLYWQPYHDAITATLGTMTATGTVPAIVSIHSFTPSWRSRARPWHVGLLWDSDPRIARPLHARRSWSRRGAGRRQRAL
jgi:predicted N-formylglutamate amidohydrolase